MVLGQELAHSSEHCHVDAAPLVLFDLHCFWKSCSGYLFTPACSVMLEKQKAVIVFQGYCNVNFI